MILNKINNIILKTLILKKNWNIYMEISTIFSDIIVTFPT